jgi:hypothetical protein
VGGDICSICCGTGREVTVSCPFECEYLQEARKHEEPAQVNQTDPPNADIHVTETALEENEEFVAFVSQRLIQAALSVPGIVDFDAREALDALIRTWRTLQSGIYYETLPQSRPAVHLYRAIRESVEEFRREETAAGNSKTRDSTVLLALVFLQRLELDRNNGRQRGRAFLNLLWEFYGAPPTEPSASSLILP